MLSLSVQAKTYYVKEGASINLQCTATAPQGYITHAVFELADPSDAQYLALTDYNTSAQTATFKGLKAKANIKIQVTYYYSFRGTYSNTMQVGHGTYNDYVTVQAGSAATSIKINPSDINMKVGETVTANVELVPSNSSSTYNVGYIETLSPPGYFEWSFENGVFTITAKKAGSLYLVAQLSEKKAGFCVIKATNDGDNTTEPTSIELSTANTSMEIGETMKMSYRLLPVGSSATIRWSSSNENIATVDSKGIVTAKSEGNVTITASTANGIEKSIDFTITPKVQNVSLPSKVETTLGFAYQLEAKVTPANAKANNCVWSSSNKDIATVSSTGKVVGKKEGEVEITVKYGDAIQATTTVHVLTPTVIDHINAGLRKAEIDALVNRTLFNITK